MAMQRRVGDRFAFRFLNHLGALFDQTISGGQHILIGTGQILFDHVLDQYVLVPAHSDVRSVNREKMLISFSAWRLGKVRLISLITVHSPTERALALVLIAFEPLVYAEFTGGMAAGQRNWLDEQLKTDAAHEILAEHFVVLANDSIGAVALIRWRYGPTGQRRNADRILSLDGQ